MKLWINSDSVNSAGKEVRATIKGMKSDIDRKILSKGTRIVNAMRNAELEVLNGQGSGRTYRRPYTKSATYTASAPGEVPARRSGMLRLHWNGRVKRKSASVVVAELESNEKYAVYLEKGTRKRPRTFLQKVFRGLRTQNMAPRPFANKILEKAKPEAVRILRGPYR